MDLPTELRRISWRGIVLAIAVGLASAWVIGGLHAQALLDSGSPVAGLPILPLQILFFVLGAGAAVGFYAGTKLLLHSLGRLRERD